jgi:hypothetical protein
VVTITPAWSSAERWADTENKTGAGLTTTLLSRTDVSTMRSQAEREVPSGEYKPLWDCPDAMNFGS